jgi:hypothetical protein
MAKEDHVHGSSLEKFTFTRIKNRSMFIYPQPNSEQNNGSKRTLAYTVRKKKKKKIVRVKKLSLIVMMYHDLEGEVYADVCGIITKEGYKHPPNRKDKQISEVIYLSKKGLSEKMRGQIKKYIHSKRLVNRLESVTVGGR